MVQHKTVKVIVGFLQGDWLEQAVTHLSSNSRMGYFFVMNQVPYLIRTPLSLCVVTPYFFWYNEIRF